MLNERDGTSVLQDHAVPKNPFFKTSRFLSQALTIYSLAYFHALVNRTVVIKRFRTYMLEGRIVSTFCHSRVTDMELVGILTAG